MLWFSCFLSDLESTYETKNTFSKKDIFEINFSQWKIKERSKTIELEASIFKNNWKCKSRFKGLQEHQERLFSQVIISYEKMPTYKKHESLIAHQRTPNQEKPYICKECGKAYRHGSKLVQHERIHMAKKHFECKECGKDFLSAYQLTVHQRFHTGEKPYECKECGKTFSWGSSLVKHERIHTGEKPYECKECGKALSRGYQLTQHHKIHTG